MVHDIETGYGDPLRMKATPDFSLRFLDGRGRVLFEINKIVCLIFMFMLFSFTLSCCCVSSREDTFAKENATIRDIQTHMETYFRGRDTRIARDGLTALTNTLAGIYYIPFKVKH